MSASFSRRASPSTTSFALTDAMLVAAAAIETILVAALILGLAGVGPGSGVAVALLRVNDLPLAPLRLVLGWLPFVPRQMLAVMLYFLFFAVLSGACSWYEQTKS